MIGAIAGQQGLNYKNKPFALGGNSTNGGTYVDMLNIIGAGWLLYTYGRQNAGSCMIKFIIDGVETNAAQYSRSVNASGGYARVSTGIYNIPIRFKTSLQIKCIYGIVNAIYVLD